MGFFKDRRELKKMGFSQAQLDRLRRIQEAADRNRQMKANPAEISMAYFALFAEEHGKSDIWDLSDVEVGHYIDLMDGIHFPIHPDEMRRNGKFGCEQCFVVYADMWRTVTKPLLEQVQHQIATGEKPPEPSAEEMKAAVHDLAEAEGFLNS